MTSLPVPVSPVIKTVVLVLATASTWLRMERRPPRRPTIVSRNEDSTGSGLYTVRSGAIGGVEAKVIVSIADISPHLIEIGIRQKEWSLNLAAHFRSRKLTGIPSCENAC